MTAIFKMATILNGSIFGKSSILNKAYSILGLMFKENMLYPNKYDTLETCRSQLYEKKCLNSGSHFKSWRPSWKWTIFRWPSMIFLIGPCNEHLVKISCLYHQVKYFLKFSHLAAPLLTKKLGFLAQSVARLTGDLGVTSSITRTCLYNVDPLEPHFYIVKLGFTGVYIIFLFLLKNIDCGYSLEPPCWGGSNEYPQSMFWAEIWKISEFFIWKFSVFGGKIFNIFE